MSLFLSLIFNHKAIDYKMIYLLSHPSFLFCQKSPVSFCPLHLLLSFRGMGHLGATQPPPSSLPPSLPLALLSHLSTSWCTTLLCNKMISMTFFTHSFYFPIFTCPPRLCAPLSYHSSIPHYTMAFFLILIFMVKSHSFLYLNTSNEKKVGCKQYPTHLLEFFFWNYSDLWYFIIWLIFRY